MGLVIDESNQCKTECCHNTMGKHEEDSSRKPDLIEASNPEKSIAHMAYTCESNDEFHIFLSHCRPCTIENVDNTEDRNPRKPELGSFWKQGNHQPNDDKNSEFF